MSRPADWRGGIKVHPAADMFPMMRVRSSSVFASVLATAYLDALGVGLDDLGGGGAA